MRLACRKNHAGYAIRTPVTSVKLCYLNSTRLSWKYGELADFPRNNDHVLFSKFWRQRPVTDSISEYEDDAANAKSIDYVKLEERRVLNASFAFDLTAAELTLDSFTNDAFTADQVDISESGSDYVFTLSDGFWLGTDSMGVSGNGTNVLIADRNAVDLVNILGNTTDSFDVNFGQLAFDGDFNIETQIGGAEFGSITQDVGTELSINSHFSVNGAGVIDLQNAGNDFDVLSIDNVLTAGFQDATSITLDGADVDSDLAVTADGVLLADTASAQNVHFQSTAGLSQTIGGDLSASRLTLTGSGTFDFGTTGNEVQQLAVDVDGNLVVDNTVSLEISELNFDTNTNVQGVNLSGDFELLTADSDVFQTAKIVVAGQTSIDVGAGHVGLADGDADGDGASDNNLFELSVFADSASVVDRNGLILLSSNVADQLAVVTGDTDADLTDNAGGRIELAGDIVVGNAILLQASSGLLQSSGFVQTGELLLGGEQQQRSSGAWELSGNNLVDQLAFDLRSDLSFANSFDLNLTGLSYSDDSGLAQVISTNVAEGNITIDVAGALSQGAALSVDGTSEFIASGDVALTDSRNDFVGEVSAVANTVEIADVNDLNVASITALEQVYLRVGGAGDGTLVLVDDVVTTSLSGSILLQASDGVQQNAGVVATSLLLIGGDDSSEATGEFNLNGANVVDAIAFQVDGELSFSASTNYGIVDATFVSSDAGLFESFTESSSTGKAILASSGSIAILAPLSAPTLLLDAGDGITQDSLGVISADELILTGTGAFDLGSAGNSVVDFAAAIDGNLIFNETDGFSIATIEYGEEFFNGVVVAGDVEMVTAGDLGQQSTAPIIVGGNAILNAAGVIQLDGASSDGEGPNENDFNTIQIVATGADVADANDLVVLGADIVERLRLAAGTADANLADAADGQLLLQGDLNVGQQVLLQASASVLQSSGIITTGDLLLGGEQQVDGNGKFELLSANDVQRLASNIAGELRFANSVTLAVAELNFESFFDPVLETIDGVATSGSDAVLIVDGSLMIEASINTGAGDVFLNVSNDVSQSATGIVIAAGLGLDVGGDVVLAAENLVDVLAGEIAGSVMLNNSVDLVVSSVTVGEESSFEMFVNGLVAGGDVKLVVGGNLDVVEAFDIDGNVILDISGDVAQTETGVVVASGLGLMVDGETVLNAANDVAVLAAENGGFTLVNVVGDAIVDSVSVDSMMVTGLNTVDADVKLTVGGSLELVEATNLGAGNLFLDVESDLNQSDGGMVSASGVGLLVDGNVDLSADNQFDVFAATVQGLTVVSGDRDLEIGNVVVGVETEFEMQLSGLQSNSDIKINVDGNLNIVESVTSDANVFLAVDGDVTQDSSGVLSALGLGLMVMGDTLLGAANDVDVIAAVTDGAVLYNDVDELIVDAVVVAAETAFEMTAVGIVAVDSDVKLQVADDLLLTEQISTGLGSTFLAIGGDLDQDDAGVILTDGLGLIVDGSTTLELENNANVLSGDTGGFVLLNDVDELIVDQVTVFESTMMEMSLVGVSTDDAEVVLDVAGDLEIAAVIDVGVSDVGLVVAGNLNQGSAGSVFANGLSLMVGGESILNDSNDFNVLTADTGGLIRVGGVDDVVIGTVSLFQATEFEMVSSGVVTADSDFKLFVGEDLSIEQSVALGSGVFFVTSLGDVSQTDAGTISAFALGLQADGVVSLNAGNDVDDFAASNSGLIVFNNIDDLNVATAEVAAGTPLVMSIAGTTTVDGDVILTVGGDLAIADQIVSDTGAVSLVVGGDLSQAGDGVIEAMQLAMVVEGSTQLLADNVVSVVAADNVGDTEFNSTQDVTIGSVEFDSMTLDGVAVDGDLIVEVEGDVSQTQAIVVAGEFSAAAGGTIGLAGADNDGDGINDNDFGGTLTAFAGEAAEIVGAMSLTVGDVVAGEQIRLQAGGGGEGVLQLDGTLETLNVDGVVLLQSNSGVVQNSSSTIVTDNLLLGSFDDSDAAMGDFILNGANTIENVSAFLQDGLEISNTGDLNIAPSQFVSLADGLEAEFGGVSVDSLVVVLVAGDLTDSATAQTVIQTSASFDTEGTIELGDGVARLDFNGHDVANLIGQSVSENSLTIGRANNFTTSVSLYVDSSVVLGDIFVSDLLFIDTVESESLAGSTGDILQTMISDSRNSEIWATNAVFVSNASVQLTNTFFERLAIDATRSVSGLIDPFARNVAIGSTFTGSIDAGVFANTAAETSLLGGDPNSPINGVFNVGQAFQDSGFVSNNNQFVNPDRVGAITVNGLDLELASFDSIGLSALQMQDATQLSNAATSLGDVYVETHSERNLDALANVEVMSGLSNITVVAGEELVLADGAQFERMDLGELVGSVNQLQGGFSEDGFVLVDPRSVIDAPGDAAFSDLLSQLDSAVGFHDFQFYFGDPGERSFNLIVGWFVDFVSPSQAIDPVFQQSLLQQMSQATSDFLLNDFSSFGQEVSAFSIGLNSQTVDAQTPLQLTNGSQFNQTFFGDRSFLLSQVFLTNDARINLFADGGSTDLNFTQEILPTRTVVENPSPIVVATPEFVVPETVGALPEAANFFVNLIQDAESAPISTEQQPETYFVIRYTADDDGVFEESFKWDDANDDPDAIRAAVEGAQLYDAEGFWPETSGEEEGGWFEKIKNEGKVKPGLYFIFEFQEGQLIPDPVDAPVDRTDIENLIEPDTGERQIDEISNGEPQEAVSSFWRFEDAFPVEQDVDASQPIVIANLLNGENNLQDKIVEAEPQRFSVETRRAMLGSSLLFAQSILDRQNSTALEAGVVDQPSSSKLNMFSRASRLLRRRTRHQS